MASIIFLNNSSSLLALSINASILTIQVASGEGANFPSPTPGTSYFVASLEDNSGNIEYVKVESRAGDVLTVETGGRGFDNSTAQSFTQNVTRVELRLTSHVMEGMLQVAGDSMSGNLDMVTNEIQNAELTGTTIVTGGQTVGTAIRGTLGQTNNELSVPAGSGVRATAGGSDILVSGDDLIAELDTAGVIDLVSATVRVEIGNTTGAVLRISDTGGTDFFELACGTVDATITGTSLQNLNFVALSIDMGGNSINMQDGILERPLFDDFAVQRQAVSASATTNIDYRAGQYVELDMDQTITNLNITNPPAGTNYGVMTLRLTQTGASRLVTNWPSGIKWPAGGAAPTLSAVSGDVDFVTLWTSDAGTTWFGDYSLDYA